MGCCASVPPETKQDTEKQIENKSALINEQDDEPQANTIVAGSDNDDIVKQPETNNKASNSPDDVKENNDITATDDIHEPENPTDDIQTKKVEPENPKEDVAIAINKDIVKESETNEINVESKNDDENTLNQQKETIIKEIKVNTEIVSTEKKTETESDIVRTNDENKVDLKVDDAVVQTSEIITNEITTTFDDNQNVETPTESKQDDTKSTVQLQDSEMDTNTTKQESKAADVDDINDDKAEIITPATKENQPATEPKEDDTKTPDQQNKNNVQQSEINTNKITTEAADDKQNVESPAEPKQDDTKIADQHSEMDTKTADQPVPSTANVQSANSWLPKANLILQTYENMVEEKEENTTKEDEPAEENKSDETLAETKEDGTKNVDQQNKNDLVSEILMDKKVTKDEKQENKVSDGNVEVQDNQALGAKDIISSQKKEEST